MAQYDLTTRFCGYLDPHLTFPLLEFINTRGIYSPSEVLGHILDTLSKTNMLDYTVDTRKRLNMDAAESEKLLECKPEIIAKLKNLKEEVAPIVNATEMLKQGGEFLQDSRSFLNVLQKDFDFQPEHLDSAFKLSKYLYECGNYNEAASYLYFCLIVMAPDDKNYLSMLWGKLATEILLLNWNAAMEDMVRVRNFIEESNMEPIRGLQQRSWLVHWSVMVFFNHPNGRNELVRMFLYNQSYLNTIQTSCPHILRYIVASVLITKAPREVITDVVRIVEQESYEYRDPVTELLERLLVQIDFEGARLKLYECQLVIVNDFFLEAYLKEFIEGGRLLIFDTYRRIYKTVTITGLASKLGMTPNQTEEWITDMISNANLKAKLNLEQGLVVLGDQQVDTSQAISNKVDPLLMRSDHLTELIELLVKRESAGGSNDWKYMKDE